MAQALVPEFSVSDWRASVYFYCDILGFDIQYQRPEEGFAYLAMGNAELMIDQLGAGRTFEDGRGAINHPFGRGLNVQIEVTDVARMLAALEREDIALYMPLEERWYRKDDQEVGNKQFVVADPDGYLLRFFESLGSRKIQVP